MHVDSDKSTASNLEIDTKIPKLICTESSSATT